MMIEMKGKSSNESYNSEKEKSPKHAPGQERRSTRLPKPKELQADFVKISDLGIN